MRDNLHLHIHCADCGKRLSFEYPYHSPAKPSTNSIARTPEPASGAFCMHMTASIKPCYNCISLATGPAKKLASAIKELTQ